MLMNIRESSILTGDIRPSALTIEQLTVDLIFGFLDRLEAIRPRQSAEGGVPVLLELRFPLLGGTLPSAPST